jgi:hypothetical protein
MKSLMLEVAVAGFSAVGRLTSELLHGIIQHLGFLRFSENVCGYTEDKEPILM